MNTLVAHTLHSLLRRDRGMSSNAGQSPAESRMAIEADGIDWAADTRPVIFRSEAFAEDLDELLAA